MIIIGLVIYCSIIIYLNGQDNFLEIEQRFRQTCARDTNLPGQFWDGQQCLQCKFDLCFCNSYLGCNSCKKGYYLDFDSKQCMECPIGCTQCCKLKKITKLICTECDQSYMILNGVCIQNEGCIKISPHGKCAECSKLNSYFKTDKGKCQRCPEGCYLCSQINYCISCDPGYYLDTYYNQSLSNAENQKIICQSCNVAKSTSKVGCQTCINKYLEDKLECVDCLPGYFYDQTQNCLECPKNCIVCTDPREGQQDICVQCKENHIPDQKKVTCINCTSSIANCIQCEEITKNGNLEFQCIECANEYYLDMNTFQCLSCKIEPGILRCETPDVITQCEENYLLIELPNIQKLQYKCIYNTYKCRSAFNEKGGCIDCKEGYHLSLRIEDINNNMTIDMKDIESLPLECLSCKETIENCLECVTNENDFTLSCLICSTSYYLREGQCYQCTENCKICETDDVCITCLQYYYKTTKDVCESCEHDFCAECQIDEESQEIKCLKCEIGYGLSLENQCWQCQKGCRKCNFKRDICQECEDIYYLSMGTCILYPENCLLANSEGFCYLCDTITIEIDEIQSEEDQIPIVNEEVEGEEGEDNDNIKIDDIFGMRLLQSEEESENEGIIFEEEISQEKKKRVSIFYKSLNGYCIVCSDFNTGSYTCLNICNAELTTVPSYQILSVFAQIYLIIYLLHMF